MIQLDIHEDAKINPNDLDLEWREQAHLFGLYAQQHAETVKRAQEIKAMLADRFKVTWDEKLDGKFSDSALRRKIESSPEYIDAEYQVNVCLSNVRTMDQKKQALENLVKLAGMNFFSTPSQPKNLNRISRFEERVAGEEVKNKIKRSLKRRK